MRYDLSATVHYKEKKDGNGHYTAISRSQDLQSQRWFMYDDDRVSLSNFTNRNTMAKKSYMKTAAILFYVSQSIIETRIKKANTIDLMEGGKEQAQNVPNSEAPMVDMCEDGEEGKADDSGDGDDKMDGEEVEEESGKVESSSGKGFSSKSNLHPNVDSQEPVHFQRQHILPRSLPTRPALTRTQQRDDYVMLRQIESERAQQRANNVLDPPVPMTTGVAVAVAAKPACKERDEGSSSESTYSSSSGSSSDSSDSSSD